MAINILDCTISCGKANDNGVYDINNFTVKYKKKTLVLGKDYYTTNAPYISDNYIISKITVYGINDYTGNKTVEYKTEIILLDINNYNFSIYEQIYCGKEIIPDIITELNINKDFRISKCTDNKEVGTGSVLLQGIGGFTGTVTVEFQILPLHIGDCTIIIPEIKDNNLDDSGIEIVNDNFILKENEDYTLELVKEKIQDAQICTIKVSGINNCIGSSQEIISLNGKFADIDKENISLESTEYQYTGEEIIPEIESDNLNEGQDYVVEINNNIDAGKGSVILRGMGAFENSVSTKGFTITSVDISTADITCGEPEEYLNEDGTVRCYIYDINNLKVSIEDIVLKRNTDYTIRIEPVDNYTTMIHSSVVHITGKGNYTGTKTQSFDTGIITKEDPEPQNPQYPEQLVPGLPIQLTKAATYSEFWSRKYNSIISGIFYIFDSIIRNNRIRITNALEKVGVNGREGGWISLDDILVNNYKYEIGDKVIVNGDIYQKPDGSGNRIAKQEAVMYIVDIIDDAEYQYNYAVATASYNNKQGWCSEDILTKYLEK